MPKMNGIQFLEQLNKIHLKQKIIIVSTLAKEGAKETIQCLELGAFDFVTKPESFIEARNEIFRQKILETIAVATNLDINPTKAPIKKTDSKQIGFSAAKAVVHYEVVPPIKQFDIFPLFLRVASDFHPEQYIQFPFQ